MRAPLKDGDQRERGGLRAPTASALIVLGIATVAFTVLLELIDPSHVSHGPMILDFEFAGSQARAAQIMAYSDNVGYSESRTSRGL